MVGGDAAVARGELEDRVVTQAQQGVDRGLAGRGHITFDGGVSHEPGADEGVGGVLEVVRSVDRSACRPPRRSILKRASLAHALAGGGLTMNTGGELLDASSTDAEAKVELRG